MSSLALFWFVQGFSLLTCLFALVKGGAAERLGGGIILANLLISTLIETQFPHALVQISQITLDGLTALSLLILTVRYASIWLGLVMLLYAAQFAIHAFYLVMERPRDMFHFLAINLGWVAINLALITGTVMSWRRNRAVAAARVAAP